MIAVPLRYQDNFVQIHVPAGEPVMTAVGPRQSLRVVWKCRRCGLAIKPNTLGAQSHITKHVRQARDPEREP